jgi:nesprin-1
VIVKIQECEATLAAAVDKGEQIAAEGSASDRNSITEQLQSLKQQLQGLRRAVENQKARHLEAVQEHSRLATELGELLDWLHQNEANVKLRPLLDITIESVDQAYQQHQVHSNI